MHGWMDNWTDELKCTDRWMDEMNKNQSMNFDAVEWDSAIANGQVFSVTDDGDLVKL